MKTAVVRDVMSRPVITVSPETGYKAIVDLLAGYGISGVPVVEPTGGVLGVVSETDLLRKVQLGTCVPAPFFEGRRRRVARVKAAGALAAELMTWPAMVIGPDASVVEAARLMETGHIKRLPVVGGAGDLMGIVARSDLLRLFLRPDVELRHEIVEDVLRRALRLRSDDLSVSVTAGVVTLTGRVDLRSNAQLAARLTHTVPGVVEVIDRVGFAFDDLEAERQLLDSDR